MNSGRFRCQTIALIAAYAMALQTLFATLAPPALASPVGSLALLCSHDAGDPGQPAHHDLPCAAFCAAIGHGVAGPMPPDVVAASVRQYARAAIGPDNQWVSPQIVLTDIHAPRGPPLA
jgi:hypothetical protein